MATWSTVPRCRAASITAGSPLSKARATRAELPRGSFSLWNCQVFDAGQARLDRVRLAGEVGDDRVPEAQGVEAEGRFLLRGVADDRPDRRGEQPLALGVEQAVVVVGGDLVAAEDDHAAPLLEVVLQRGDLGLGELRDVAEHHRVVGGQVAARELRLGDDLGPDRRRRSRRGRRRG